MESYHRVHVHLTKKDLQHVSGMLSKGRPLILRQLDSGQTAAQVASNVGVAAKTVRAVGRRYEEQGLDSALYEKPRPGKQRALNAGQSQICAAMLNRETVIPVTLWPNRFLTKP